MGHFTDKLLVTWLHKLDFTCSILCVTLGSVALPVCGGARSCWSPWAPLWQSTGQAGQCHPDEPFPPDAALTWWAVILAGVASSGSCCCPQRSRPCAAPCPSVPSSLLPAGVACPGLLLVPCPHTPGVQGRGEQQDLAMGWRQGLRELLSPECV